MNDEKKKTDFGSEDTSLFIGIIAIIGIAFLVHEFQDLGIIVSGLIGIAVCAVVFLSTHGIMKLIAKHGDITKIRKVMNVIRIVLLVAAFLLCGISTEPRSSSRKWSDLEDYEQDNARWAYYAKQAIDGE